MTNHRQSHSSEQTPRARQLRKAGTIPERLLWARLRNGQLLGLKFRRQEPVGPYFVDFVCLASMLAIEIDGDSHIGRADYDRERATEIEAAGFRILRVGNDDVVQDIDSVLTGIILACGLDPESSTPMARKSNEKSNTPKER
jgi:very-short-patch-repair endonuclease